MIPLGMSFGRRPPMSADATAPSLISPLPPTRSPPPPWKNGSWSLHSHEIVIIWSGCVWHAGGSAIKKANISKIKAELSKYLRYVRAGEEVLILDREQVVAKMVPIALADKLRVIPPSSDLREVIASFGTQRFDQTLDIVDLLAADREDRL